MSTTSKPQGCTNFKLRQLMRFVARHYDAAMAQQGIKTTQYSLLSHVLKLGPIRPVDLARAMGLTPSTLTRNLQPMLAAGWLVMDEGPDARSRLISITEPGRDKREEAQRSWKAAQLALNDILGVERVAALHVLAEESTALLREQQGEEVEDFE